MSRQLIFKKLRCLNFYIVPAYYNFYFEKKNFYVQTTNKHIRTHVIKKKNQRPKDLFKTFQALIETEHFHFILENAYGGHCLKRGHVFAKRISNNAECNTFRIFRPRHSAVLNNTCVELCGPKNILVSFSEFNQIYTLGIVCTPGNYPRDTLMNETQSRKLK